MQSLNRMQGRSWTLSLSSMHKDASSPGRPGDYYWTVTLIWL